MIVKKHEWVLKYAKGKKTIYHMGSAGENNNGALHKILKERLKDSELIGVDIMKGPFTDVVMDLNKPDFSGMAKADCIIATAVIEHLKEPYRFLEACHGLLKKGGLIMLDTNNASYYLTKHYFEHLVSKNADMHYYVWIPEFFQRLVESAGFKTVSCETGILYYKLTAKQLLSGFFFVDYLVSKIFKPFRSEIYLVAKK
jgi:hypothetical protein